MMQQSAGAMRQQEGGHDKDDEMTRGRHDEDDETKKGRCIKRRHNNRPT